MVVCSPLSLKKREGWDDRVDRYVHCGGYQMMGLTIRAPHDIEGPPGETDGLGLLGLETILEKGKTLSMSSGYWKDNDEPVEGYEIHMAVT